VKGGNFSLEALTNEAKAYKMLWFTIAHWTHSLPFRNQTIHLSPDFDDVF
jgi:hypothetical protein